MSTSSGNTETTQYDTRDGDLAYLRARLWRRSSLLTCGVLIFVLAIAWVLTVLSVRVARNATLSNSFTSSLLSSSLIDAHERSQPSIAEAHRNYFDPEEQKKRLEEWKPTATAPDTYFSVLTGVQTPFSVAVFEDGSISFLIPPTNVFAGEGDAAYGLSWSEEALEELVESAFELRESAGKYPEPQLIEVAGMTWASATRIAVTNPRYDPDVSGESGVMLYAEGKLKGYEEDGNLAARIFSFVDVTPSIQYLKFLAMGLMALGIVGCILLVAVCRKIVDRALGPVGEAWDRQREFLIKASHELKTPMASLSSNLDALVVNGDETVASQAQWTDNMREDIDQLADRTCRLLDLVTQPGEVEEGPEEK